MDRSHIQHIRNTNVDEWHSTVCRAFSRTSFLPAPSDAFGGELTQATHGGARLSRVNASAGRFVRDAQMIRRDNFDGFMIMVMLQGHGQLAQNDKALLARHGEALVYRHGKPFDLEMPDRYWSVSLWVEPDLMQRHCPDIANESAVSLKPETTSGSLALTIIKELCVNSVTKGADNAAPLIGAALDILATNSARPALAEATRNDWLIDKLSTYLRRNIEDTDITLDDLVRVSGVSARTLNRAFAHKGTTPVRWVWDTRLDLAYDALDRSRVRNVTEAALSFGFKDSAHFSRVFSRRFGVAPSAVLRRN